jgi:pimeloyl-ACP methyl ester carboxylesterase
LLLFGAWGRTKVSAIIAGPTPRGAPPTPPAIADFRQLIFRNFRVRTEKLPIFRDEELQRLTMPVMAILGGRDVIVDSPAIRKRLEANVPAEIVWLADADHFLRGQTKAICDFLSGATTYLHGCRDLGAGRHR